MARAAVSYTVDELIFVCIARQVTDGDVLVQGIATPLVMAGYLLREVTDLLGSRHLEALSGAARRHVLPQVLASEGTSPSPGLTQPQI